MIIGKLKKIAFCVPQKQQSVCLKRHEGVINDRFLISGQIIPLKNIQVICSSCGESFSPNKFQVSLKGVNEFGIF